MKPLFELWSVYMGIAKIAFDPPAPSVKRAPLGHFFRTLIFPSAV